MKWIVVVALLTCACAPRQTINIGSPFDPLLTTAQLKPGMNNISGSALIRQRGGGIVSCAGCPVLLIPVNDYSKERMNIIYGSTEKGFISAGSLQYYQEYNFIPDPPEYTTLRRETVGDALGNFVFDNLRDGGYFVITSIVWMGGNGGRMMQRVDVAGGESKRIVLCP